MRRDDYHCGQAEKKEMPKATRATAAEDMGVSDAVEEVETELDSNESLCLTVELLSATKLVPEDRLALVRGRAEQTGSLGTALVEEGVASGDGIARMLALHHQMAHVDLATLVRMVTARRCRIDLDAAKLFPLHVLERVTAVPYAFADDASSASQSRIRATCTGSTSCGSRREPARARRRLPRRHPRSDPRARAKTKGIDRLPSVESWPVTEPDGRQRRERVAAETSDLDPNQHRDDGILPG